MAYTPREDDLKHLADNEFAQLSPLLTTLVTKRNPSGQFPHRDIKKIDTIVLHWTASQYKGFSGAITTLKGNGNGYHFFIEQDGKVTQSVEVGRTAYHAGNAYGPDDSGRGTRWLNKYSIGISFVMGYINKKTGQKDTIVKPKMIESLHKLLKELIPVLPNLKYITGHVWITPSHRSDPFSFNFNDLMGEKFIKDANIELWKTGYFPFPAGLNDCKCIKYDTLDKSGKQYCIKSKGKCNKKKDIGKKNENDTFDERRLKRQEDGSGFSSDRSFSQDGDTSEEGDSSED